MSNTVYRVKSKVDIELIEGVKTEDGQSIVFEGVCEIAEVMQLRYECITFHYQGENFKLNRLAVPTCFYHIVGSEGSSCQIHLSPLSGNHKVIIKKEKPVLLSKAVFQPEESIVLLNDIFNGEYSAAICGGPGSGKSTLLKNVVSFIPDEKKLCLTEVCPELQLQAAYPNKQFVSAKDADVSIVGEIATDKELALFARKKLPILFTSHYRTPQTLINALKDVLPQKQFIEMANKVKYFVFIEKLDNGKCIISKIVEMNYTDTGDCSEKQLFNSGDYL